jgi:hypothetical protein
MPWDFEALSAFSNEDLIQFKMDLLHVMLLVNSN